MRAALSSTPIPLHAQEAHVKSVTGLGALLISWISFAGIKYHFQVIFARLTARIFSSLDVLLVAFSVAFYCSYFRLSFYGVQKLLEQL